MIDNKSLIVLAYLKNHFKTSSKGLTAVEIHIDGLVIDDIQRSLNTLANNGCINLYTNNIHPIVKSVY